MIKIENLQKQLDHKDRIIRVCREGLKHISNLDGMGGGIAKTTLNEIDKIK